MPVRFRFFSLLIIPAVICLFTACLASAQQSKFEPPTILQEKKALSTTGTIRFATISDQHYGFRDDPISEGDALSLDDWMYHPSIGNLDFVVSSFGDLMSDNRLGPGNPNYNPLEPWDEVEYTWQRIAEANVNKQKLPYFFIWGNHDSLNYEGLPPDNNPLLKDQIAAASLGQNEHDFAFLYNNVLFIAHGTSTETYEASEFQKNWIQYLLGRYPNTATVIWSPQAIFETTGLGDERATSWDSNDYRYHNDFSWWRDLFEANPQIVLFIHGHTEKAFNSVVHDLHPESWDDNCTFVLIPSNGRTYDQDNISFVFSISSNSIDIQLWNSQTQSFEVDEAIGLPYKRRYLNNKVQNTGLEWFSQPRRVIDGETWSWKNRILAEDYKLELIGSNVVEQLFNADLRGCHESDEDSGENFKGYFYAVRGDEYALNLATGDVDEFVIMPGDGNGTGNCVPCSGDEYVVELATTPTFRKFVEGKIPHNTAIAVPGKQYTFEATLSTTEVAATGTADFLITILQKNDLFGYVWEDQVILSSIAVTDTPTTFSQTFTVPSDNTAWIIQPKIVFHPTSNPGVANYRWDDWSLQMVGTAATTQDFTVDLNGEVFGGAGSDLANHDYQLFSISKTTVDNDLSFEATTINGNRVGMIRMIYERPQIWSDDASFGVQTSDQTLVTMEDVAPYNDRTTVMSFEGSHVLFTDDSMACETVRDKKLFYHLAGDSSLDGTYNLLWNQTNFPPDTPARPGGFILGSPGELFTFTTVAVASDGEPIFYMWDWGNGTFSNWFGPFDSGVSTSAQKIWSTPGTYQVRVKAKDTMGAECGWSEPRTVRISDLRPDSSYLEPEGGFPPRITDGLVVFYPFNEGSGTQALDQSNNGSPMDLQISGTVTWLPGANGVVTGGGKLATTTQATKLIDAVKASNQASFEVWIRSANLSQTGPARILSVGQGVAAQNYVLGQIEDDMEMRLLHTGKDAQANPRLITSDGFLTQELTHVVHTFDGATETLYIDGQPHPTTVVQSGTLANWVGTNRFNVGNEASDDRAWLGIIRLVAVYDRALTPYEVRQNYGAGANFD